MTETAETFWQRHLREQEERKNALRPSIFETLRESHPTFTQVVIEYDGEGDSGCIGDIRIYENNAETPSYVLEYSSVLGQMLEEFAHLILPMGWEINDGSYGEIEINVASEEIHVDHHARFIDTHDSSWDA